MRLTTKSLLASFTVYLLPLFTPHIVLLWGVVLAMELATQSGKREAAWLACDLALALLLQAGAFLVFTIVFRSNRIWRYALPLAAAPAFFVVLEWAYLIAIPTHFLIEKESAAEQTSWTVECTVADAHIAPVATGVSLALEQAQETWIARGESGALALLTMPGCQVRDRGFTLADTGGTVNQVAPGGAMLYRRWESAAQDPAVELLLPGASAPVAVPAPRDAESKDWAPVLATDGKALAWMSSTRSERRGIEQHVWIRDLVSGDEQRVSLPRVDSGWARLVAYEPNPPRLFLVADGIEAFAVDLEGNVKWGPVRPQHVERLSDNFRRPGDGWVAWDVYREDARYEIEWSLDLGRGHLAIPKGRSITSVAVDPGGRHLAVTVGPVYSIGNVRDAVFVVRVRDGKEVYRRYLPPYSRSRVAFLGAHFLALDRVEGTTSHVEVLRVPGPNSAEERGKEGAWRAARMDRATVRNSELAPPPYPEGQAP